MTEAAVTSRYKDGNALAGPLADMFNVDITTAQTWCVGCRRESSVAELHLYDAGPGFVARCPGCNEPIIRYVRTTTKAILDMRGTLRLAAPVTSGNA